MLSVKKYIACVDNLHIDDETADRLFAYLGNRSSTSIFNASELSAALNIGTFGVYRILTALVRSGVTRYAPVECPNCHHVIDPVDSPPEHCPECWQAIDIYRDVYFQVGGFAKATTDEELRAHYLEVSARKVSQRWSKQGFAYYLMFDLIGSELLQKEDDYTYAAFLEVMRDIMKFYVFSQCKHPFFFLGEVGDLSKAILTDGSDAEKVVRKFSQCISNDQRLKSIGEQIEAKGIFPRYKSILGWIGMPIRKDGKQGRPEDIFKRTLDGPLDINSSDITSLYRIEGQLKHVKDEYYNQPFDLALWVTSQTCRHLSFDFPYNAPFSFGSYDDAHLILLNNGNATYYPKPS